MYNSSVTTKGQVVIPVEIRRHHGIGPGARIAFEDHEDYIIIRPVTHALVDKIKGSLGKGGKALKELYAEKEREKKL